MGAKYMGYESKSGVTGHSALSPTVPPSLSQGLNPSAPPVAVPATDPVAPAPDPDPQSEDAYVQKQMLLKKILGGRM